MRRSSKRFRATVGGEKREEDAVEQVLDQPDTLLDQLLAERLRGLTCVANVRGATCCGMPGALMSSSPQNAASSAAKKRFSVSPSSSSSCDSPGAYRTFREAAVHFWRENRESGGAGGNAAVQQVEQARQHVRHCGIRELTQTAPGSNRSRRWP